MTTEIRSRLGIVKDSEIDVILDASGFRYSDQWGVGPLISAANLVKQWKRRGKRVILMPQAFGPFELSGASAAARILVEHCDLIYARDRQSMEYLVDAAGGKAHVKLAPDFTNMVSPKDLDDGRPARIPVDSNVAVVVPNSRMLDKVDSDKGRKYLDHLHTLVDQARRRGLRTTMLFFDPNDAHFAQRLPVDDVMFEENPRVLKAIIGRARVLIGSRFHALICALTQGVPVIGSGWSHKYETLFEEYGCSNCLLDVDVSPERVQAVLHYVLDESSRAELISTLVRREAQVREDVMTMWGEIDDLLFGTRVV